MRKPPPISWSFIKPTNIFLIVGFLMLITQSFAAHAANGRVVDKATGKPIEGVFVTAEWYASVSGVVNSGSTSCYHFAITQTDRDGKYVLPDWSWFFWPFHFDRYTTYDYYYPYYVIDARPDKQKNVEIEMRRFTGANELRMNMLANRSFIGCESREKLAQKTIPIIRARFNEAKEIAKSPTELELLKSIKSLLERSESLANESSPNSNESLK